LTEDNTVLEKITQKS